MKPDPKKSSSKPTRSGTKKPAAKKAGKSAVKNTPLQSKTARPTRHIQEETDWQTLLVTQATIIGALPAHIVLVDAGGTIRFVSEGAAKFKELNGFTGERIAVGENYLKICEAAASHLPEEAKRIAVGLNCVLAGNAPEFSLDYACHAPEEKQWFRVMITPLIPGKPGGAVITHVDITERKLVEERLLRINRLYVVLSRINETIVRTENRTELFASACRIAVEQGLFQMATVMGFDEVTGMVRPIAFHGVEAAFFEGIAVNVHESRLSLGTIGMAISTRVYNICNDVLKDPRMEPWRDFYLQRGYRSAGSFPIIIDNRVIGVLVLLANEVDYFLEDEIELLVAVQWDLAFAVQSLEKEAELRAQTLQLANAQLIGRMGSWSYDVRKDQLDWSEATCHLFGITKAGFRGTLEHFTSFVLPEDLPSLIASRAKTSPGHSLLEAEYRIRRPDGAIRWMYERGNIAYDATGAEVSRIGMVTDVTEQHSARDRLEQRATLLRMAGKVARLGGWIIELPERKLTWSDETCVIHDLPPGYQPTLEEGMSMFPPESRTLVARHVETCIQDGTPYDFEVIKTTAKGRQIWVRSIGEAVRDEEGRIVRLQGAFQDITERKRAELELARSNRALRMLSACNEALIHANDEPQLLKEICRLAVSEGGYVMAWVGYAREDEECTIEPVAYAGKEQGYLSVARLSWSEQHLSGRGPAGQAIRSGQVSICEDVTRGTSLHWRDAALSRGYKSIICLPLRSEKRTFGMMALYSPEISQPSEHELKLMQDTADDLAFGIAHIRSRMERQQAEQKIVQQAELIDKATDAIYVRDLEHRVTFWNQGAERIYGWNAGEIVGRATRQFLCPDLFAFQEAVRELQAKGEWTGELHKKNKAGQTLVLDCRWTLMRDQAGVPVSILAIETDITQQKKLETQVLRTQRMESLGTLAGGIAHDLNNILSPIMISIEMLKQDCRTPETRKMLETLEMCSKRGAELVRQVLSFARGIEGQRVVVNLLQLTKELLRILRDVFPKNVEAEVSGTDDLWTVTGDPTQLHQVLLNLCVNARDAMPHGGHLSITLENVRLTADEVAADPWVKAGAFVSISVMDSGVGIDPVIRDRIFEPFFTTKETGKGTGLGLSTVLGIIKSHGGFISVYSEVGQGTRFKVYLPANATENEANKMRSEGDGLPRGNGELILVVDDEETIRRITQKTLEVFGYMVVSATNGAEALDIYRARHNEIAVVLTDISMPIMDGTALIVALKKISPQICIIASSGLTSNEGVTKASGVEIAHFISKPYTAEKLLRTLHAEIVRAKPPVK